MLFWNYSNTTYRTEGIPTACLTLQNNFGMDVNMVLFCCWYGITHGVIDAQLFQQCLDFSHTWSTQTVKPLRNIRTWLKDTGCTQYSFDTDTCMGYRDRVKAVELEAEKIQQITLESFCQKIATADLADQDKTAATAQNLKNYLDAENIQLTEGAIEELLFIIQVSIDNPDSAAFRKILSG